MNKLHIINSGRADCFVLEITTALGKNIIVIDSGTKEYQGRRPLNDFLKKNLITNIDYVIVTHFHQDHFGGLSVIDDEITIGHAIIPFPLQQLKEFIVHYEKEQNQFEEYQAFYQNLVSQRTTIRTVMSDSKHFSINLGEYTLKCLHFVNASQSEVIKNIKKMNELDEINEQYFIYYKQFKKHCNLESSIWALEKNEECIAIFLGDSPLNVANAVLQTYQKKPRILKVSHHGIGSEYFSCQQIEQLTPKQLIVTTDEKNKRNFLLETEKTLKNLQIKMDIPYEKGDFYYDI